MDMSSTSLMAAATKALEHARDCIEGVAFAVRDVLTRNAGAPYGSLRVDTWAMHHRQQCRTAVLTALEAVGLPADVLTAHPDAARLAIAVLAGLVLCVPLLSLAWCCGLLRATRDGEGEVNVFWRGAIERREEAAAAAVVAAAGAAAVGAAPAETKKEL